MEEKEPKLDELCLGCKGRLAQQAYGRIERLLHRQTEKEAKEALRTLSFMGVNIKKK
jgi:hypothetical protein